MPTRIVAPSWQGLASLPPSLVDGAQASSSSGDPPSGGRHSHDRLSERTQSKEDKAERVGRRGSSGWLSQLGLGGRHRGSRQGSRDSRGSRDSWASIESFMSGNSSPRNSLEGPSSPRTSSPHLNQTTVLRRALRCRYKKRAVLLALVYALVMLLVLPYITVSKRVPSGHPAPTSFSKNLSNTGGGGNTTGKGRGGGGGAKSGASDLEAATRAAEDEAKARAAEEAPLLAKLEAQRAEREANKERLRMERLANLTKRHELAEQNRMQRRLAAHGRKSNKPHPNVSASTPSPAGDIKAHHANGNGHAKGGGVGAGSTSGRVQGAAAGRSRGGSGASSTGGVTTAVSGGERAQHLQPPSPPPSLSADAADKEVLHQASHVLCVDGTRLSAVLGVDAARRRKLVRALALERAVHGSTRPLFLRLFLASGLLDQLRFMWSVPRAMHPPGRRQYQAVCPCSSHRKLLPSL